MPAEERVTLGLSKRDGEPIDLIYFLHKIAEDDLSARTDFLANFFIYELAAVCFRVIETLGYDPAAAMSQTLQKIGSRRGAYDETLKKWVKDTSDEARAQWFTPNYALCKRD